MPHQNTVMIKLVAWFQVVGGVVFQYQWPEADIRTYRPHQGKRPRYTRYSERFSNIPVLSCCVVLEAAEFSSIC